MENSFLNDDDLAEWERRNEDERLEAEKNKQRFALDLASASQRLYELENDIQGQRGAFSQWLRVAHELNEDFTRPFAEVVGEICDAIRYADRQYGREIALRLYNSQEIILPDEIRRAAQYLSYGGRFESLKGLAQVGFFEADYSHEELLCAINFMNAGGAVIDVFRIVKHESTDSQPGGKCTLTLY
ncbi:MAG: hypothetical protein ACLU6E_02250 [Dysosmobacter welbionis]|uniref:hypothetical protein n=1 Tax=Dysosmobacter welbionis TaxID=2093857 RepID=UPI003999E3E3